MVRGIRKERQGERSDLQEIANKMDKMGKRGRGTSQGSQLREDGLVPGTRSWQRGSQTGRARKLSLGNKNKRDLANFTFLLSDNRKMSGKVLHKVRHLCVCVH